MTIKILEHNHDLSNLLLVHPSTRCFSDDKKKMIIKMSRSNIRPRQILTTLRNENPYIGVSATDLYNFCSSIREEKLRGQTTIEALIEDLQERCYQYFLNYDSDGNLSHPFFTHPKSILLTKS